MTEQSECTICLLDYNEETKTETKCNHIFHQECLDKWLQTNYTCPLCRTELKKDTLCRPIYALPSEQQHRRYNWNRVYPMTSVLASGNGIELIMTEPGYNAEDSIVFGRELIDEGIQPQQEQGFTLRRRENVHELREYQRLMMDYLLSQSHPEMLHSDSTGITRVGSPVELNVTYRNPEELDEVWTLLDSISATTDSISATAAAAEDDSSDEEDEYTRIYGSHIRVNFD